MALKKKPAVQPLPENIQEGIIDAVGRLYQKHADEIADVVGQSETRQIVVGFSVGLDLSESEPSIKVTIRFSQCVTDSLLSRIPDPQQGTFEFSSPGEAPAVEAKPAKKSRKGGDDDGAETD